MIERTPNGDLYGVRAMDRLGYFKEENTKKRIFCCASSRSESGVEVVAPKSKVFCVSLAALPIVDTIAECRWRREECGGMTGLGFEALRLKTKVK